MFLVMNKGSENLEPKSSAGRRVDGAALREVIEPVTLAYGLELVALEWSGDLLRVIIDRSTVAGAPLAGGASSLGAPVAEVPVWVGKWDLTCHARKLGL